MEINKLNVKIPYMTLWAEDMINAGYTPKELTKDNMERIARKMGYIFASEFHETLKSVR